MSNDSVNPTYYADFSGLTALKKDVKAQDPSALRAVAPATAVAVDLPRDRRVRTTDHPADRPEALTTRQAARNLLALPL